MQYNKLINEAHSLFNGERNFIANAANLTALIYLRLAQINWVGFYFINGSELILGPFQGKPACIRIQIGKGVCGAAAKERLTVLVDNVHEFPGHIACDDASNSEIVVPLIHEGKLYAVLDIDSPVKKRFDDIDKEVLEEIVEVLIKSSDIKYLSKYYDV